jgi:hypothetical protein
MRNDSPIAQTSQLGNAFRVVVVVVVVVDVEIIGAPRILSHSKWHRLYDYDNDNDNDNDNERVCA